MPVNDLQTTKFPLLVFLSAVDFDWPTWTNKQQLATRFAQSGRIVVYVEPVTSILQVLAHPIRYKLWTKLFPSIKPVVDFPGLFIVRPPLGLPFAMKLPLSAWLNGFVYARVVHWASKKTALKHFQTQNVAAACINYLPNNYPTIQFLRRKQPNMVHVYDCVDDYGSFPGAWVDRVRKDEAITASLSDRVSITSMTLASYFQTVSDKVVFNPNVADYALFAQARAQGPLHPFIQSSRSSQDGDSTATHRARVIYTGTLNFKFDADLVHTLISSNTEIDFYFVGPDEIQWQSQIAKYENAFWHNSVPRQQLPALLRGATIGLIPFVLNSHTAAVFPLKFFEYLGAGLAVVSTKLPSLLTIPDISECAVYFSDSTEMSETLRTVIKVRPEEMKTKIEKGAGLAARNRWEDRMERLLTGL